jgi:membrane-associated phospholipid phosphatase
VIGAYAVATVAMFPLDRRLASLVRDSSLVTNKRLMRVSSVFRFFGGFGPFLIGGGMYAVGRLTKVDRAAELGLHGTEAIVVGQSVAAVLKVTAGRARPYTTADTNPRNFSFGRGFQNGDYKSFPSGHSTTAFAAAAAVSAETFEWWPQTRWIIGPILYGGAALVALSRIYEDKHWASDVVVGSAIGSFAGLKVVRFNNTHEGNRIDRWFLGARGGSSNVRLTGDATTIGFAAHLVW